MSRYNYHQECHYNDLISFIVDLYAEFGQESINNILANHYQLSVDLSDYDEYFLENIYYEN